jgi:acetyl esterase/lipase
MSLRLSLPLLLLGALPASARAEEVLLWPKGAPGSEGKTAPEAVRPSTDGVRRIYSIHKPSLTVVLPPAERASGTAIIVLPGGGHQYLSIENEGEKAAKWLAERGVAGLVLKYRLAREEGSTYRVDVEALQDVQRAIRMARSRAREWHVRPDRIGVMGFSAGGQLAALASMRFDGGKESDDPIDRESSRPSFQVLMYPGGVAADAVVPKDAPPAFLCVAFDDKSPSRTSLELFQKLRDAGATAELHVYSQGGHGFGMRDRPLPITGWPVRLLEWMRVSGWLPAAGVN